MAIADQARVDELHALGHEPFGCPYADNRVRDCGKYQAALVVAGQEQEAR